MTIASETNKSGPYNGNGATTVFAYGFRILDETHVTVIKTVTATGVETAQTLTTHYTVSGVGDATGSITMLTAPATGTTITIVRDVPFTQELDLENQGAFLAETVEEAFDKLTQQTQQLKEGLDRAVRVAASSSTDPDDLIANLEASEAAAAVSAAAAAASEAAAAVSEAAATAAAATTTTVPVQIDAATDEAFADTAHLTARKADGTLLKRTWANVKAALKTYFDTLYVTGANTAQTRNRIVNPAMQVSQENVNTAGTTTGYYGADQFATYFVTSAGTITTQRVQSVTPDGSKDRYRVTITAADASLAAGEYLTITQNIEGQEVADLQYGSAAAVDVVLRFGFKGPAGTYAARLGNSAADRSYVALFTIAAPDADTDTEQSITIVGDTTGTWLTDTGIGITLDIVLACGSTFQGVTGWQAGLMLGTSGVSNGMGTVSAVFELFDVGLYADPDSTGVAPAWEMPDRAHEKIRCRRYWWKTYAEATAVGTVTTVGALGAVSASTGSYGALGSWVLPVPMRIAPAIATYNPATGASGSWRAGASDYTMGNATITPSESTFLLGTSGSAPAAGSTVHGHVVAAARM